MVTASYYYSLAIPLAGVWLIPLGAAAYFPDLVVAIVAHQVRPHGGG